MSRYRIEVERSGKYWAVFVPALERWTQARHLGEVDEMARDLIAIMTDEDPADIDLDVAIAIPEVARQHIEREKLLRQWARSTNAHAAVASRTAACALRDEGMTLRDIGRLLGVSYQRAHQLTREVVVDPADDDTIAELLARAERLDPEFVRMLTAYLGGHRQADVETRESAQA